MKEISGFDAVVSALKDAKVDIVTYVPGVPITKLAETLNAEIAINEKVAMEIALGSSATGSRSMVVVKQVGMNILADPMVISVATTIGSGLVILAGDDLGPVGSQTEMDSRVFGQLAEIPVFDPKDPAILYLSIIEAYQLSEYLRIPVVVRVTNRLLTSIVSLFQHRL
jgi:indolepyruvate ferredoxin oxidoreductase alpha subunit